MHASINLKHPKPTNSIYKVQTYLKHNNNSELVAKTTSQPTFTHFHSDWSIIPSNIGNIQNYIKLDLLLNDVNFAHSEFNNIIHTCIINEFEISCSRTIIKISDPASNKIKILICGKALGQNFTTSGSIKKVKIDGILLHIDTEKHEIEYERVVTGTPRMPEWMESKAEREAFKSEISIYNSFNSENWSHVLKKNMYLIYIKSWKGYSLCDSIKQENFSQNELRILLINLLYHMDHTNIIYYDIKINHILYLKNILNIIDYKDQIFSYVNKNLIEKISAEFIARDLDINKENIDYLIIKLTEECDKKEHYNLSLFNFLLIFLKFTENLTLNFYYQNLYGIHLEMEKYKSIVKNNNILYQKNLLNLFEKIFNGEINQKESIDYNYKSLAEDLKTILNIST